MPKKQVKFVISSLEFSPADERNKYPQYKIKTSTGKTGYSTQSRWNSDWKPGMEVEADIEEKVSKGGNAYFTATCPERFKAPKSSESNQEVTTLLRELVDTTKKILARLEVNKTTPLDEVPFTDTTDESFPDFGSDSDIPF